MATLNIITEGLYFSSGAVFINSVICLVFEIRKKKRKTLQAQNKPLWFYASGPICSTVIIQNEYTTFPYDELEEKKKPLRDFTYSICSVSYINFILVYWTYWSYDV